MLILFLSLYRSSNFVRLNYVGGTVDISVNILNKSLEDAQKIVAILPAKYEPYSVLMVSVN